MCGLQVTKKGHGAVSLNLDGCYLPFFTIREIIGRIIALGGCTKEENMGRYRRDGYAEIGASSTVPVDRQSRFHLDRIDDRRRDHRDSRGHRHPELFDLSEESQNCRGEEQYRRPAISRDRVL